MRKSCCQADSNGIVPGEIQTADAARSRFLFSMISNNKDRTSLFTPPHWVYVKDKSMTAGKRSSEAKV